MWWKKKKVEPTPQSHPHSAEEMKKLADWSCRKITKMFFDEIIKDITRQSLAGNHSFSPPEKYFDEITIGYRAPDNDPYKWLGSFHIRPSVDFKFLKEMLEDEGFMATVNGFGKITTVYWIKPRPVKEPLEFNSQADGKGLLL